MEVITTNETATDALWRRRRLRYEAQTSGKSSSVSYPNNNRRRRLRTRKQQMAPTIWRSWLRTHGFEKPCTLSLYKVSIFLLFYPSEHVKRNIAQRAFVRRLSLCVSAWTQRAPRTVVLGSSTTGRVLTAILDCAPSFSFCGTTQSLIMFSLSVDQFPA